ncbi:uncharacterized protein BT62DRAFT_329926 [Guyanagaster necrorhizus]|uniref:Uncharacterized protein n=1 Tax=Guyanagaster necrorhizus TaxID=856835 RepID=A0A9P7VMS8_9AGAR|nr:uncharacterized protein BT62DRAFT_329926 [Guyanagaster necrorhizus MCA 3950]KAG7443410.1 hypothetical protein BT62DRAFT_329926 [Guyanagaster necrorhizus MCA 3950]
MSFMDIYLSEEEMQVYLDGTLNSYICGFFIHGIYTGLYAMSVHCLATNCICKARIYMGFLITALYILCTIQIAVSWIELRIALVYGTSVQSRYDLIDTPLSSKIMSAVASALNILVASCTIIWRCWVVWGQSWKIVILPILFIVCEIFCRIKLVVHQYTSSSGDDVVTKWAVATIATTLGTNILCTTLIVTRIVRVTRQQRGVGLGTYRDVIEILVESAALYSISYLLLMVCYPLSGNGYMYTQMLVYPITGIAPTLIIARVASGQARPEESWHGPPSLGFTDVSHARSTTTTEDHTVQRDRGRSTSVKGKGRERLSVLEPEQVPSARE